MKARAILAHSAALLCAAILWQCGNGATDLGSGGIRDAGTGRDGGSPGETDGGGGRQDAGKPDAGMDAGRDAGSIDDVGPSDGSVEAGAAGDAGETDAAETDAGSGTSPDALGITGIVRKDTIPSYTRLAISDPRAVAAIPTGYGFALAGDIGAAFKATPFGGGNLYFKGWNSGEWLGRGRNGSSIATAFRTKQTSGYYNPTQGGFKDICGAQVQVVPKEGASSFSMGAANRHRIEFKRFRAVLADQNAQGYDFVQYEGHCLDANDRNGVDDDYWPDVYPNAGPGDGDRQDAELSSEFDLDGFYEDARSLVTSEPNVAVLRRVQVFTYAHPPDQIKQFDAKGYDASNIAQEDIRTKLDGDQRGQQYDATGLDMNWNTRIGMNTQAKMLNIWYADDAGNLAHDPALKETCDKKCNVVHAYCLKLPDREQNSFGFGAGCTPESTDLGTDKEQIKKNTTFPLLIQSESADANGPHAVGVYYPFRSWANQEQVKCIRLDGTVVYEEDRRRDVTFRAMREGNNEGQDREQEGESPTYWFDQAFTNLGIAMGNVGLLNPESTDGPQWVDPATGLSNDCTEDLWGEIFYLFGSPQQIWDAAHEIDQKINDPAFYAEPAARNYDLEYDPRQ